MRAADFAALAIGLFLAYGGITCLTRAQAIQKKTLRYYDAHPGRERFNLAMPFMRTPRYLVYLRIVGVIQLIVLCLLILVAIFGKHGPQGASSQLLPSDDRIQSVAAQRLHANIVEAGAAHVSAAGVMQLDEGT